MFTLEKIKIDISTAYEKVGFPKLCLTLPISLTIVDPN